MTPIDFQAADDEEDDAPAPAEDAAPADPTADAAPTADEKESDDAGDDQVDAPAAAPVAPPAAAPAVPVDPNKPDPDQMRAYLEKMYGQAADNSGVKDAQANARRANVIANIGQAVEGLARANSQAHGGQGVNEGLYQGIRQQGQQGVAQAQAARQQAIQDFVTKNQLGRQANEDSQKNAQFADWQGDHTPGSGKAVALVAQLNKMFPDYPISPAEAKSLSVADVNESWSKPLELRAKIDANTEAQKLRLAMTAAQTGNKVGQKNEDRDLAFNKDYGAEQKKYQAHTAAIDDAMSTVDLATKAGGGVAASVVPAALAKSIVNRVTQGEIGQFSGDPSMIARIQSLWSKANDGTMTVGNAQEFKTLLASQRANADQAWATTSEGMLKPYALTTGQDLGALRSRLGGPVPAGQGGTSGASQPPAAPLSPDVLNAQAWLKANPNSPDAPGVIARLKKLGAM